jgi:hypothetical protein
VATASLACAPAPDDLAVEAMQDYAEIQQRIAKVNAQRQNPSLSAAERARMELHLTSLRAMARSAKLTAFGSD